MSPIPTSTIVDNVQQREWISLDWDLANMMPEELIVCENLLNSSVEYDENPINSSNCLINHAMSKNIIVINECEDKEEKEEKKEKESPNLNSFSEQCLCNDYNLIEKEEIVLNGKLKNDEPPPDEFDCSSDQTEIVSTSEEEDTFLDYYKSPPDDTYNNNNDKYMDETLHHIDEAFVNATIYADLNQQASLENTLINEIEIEFASGHSKSVVDYIPDNNGNNSTENENSGPDYVLENNSDSSEKKNSGPDYVLENNSNSSENKNSGPDYVPENNGNSSENKNLDHLKSVLDCAPNNNETKVKVELEAGNEYDVSNCNYDDDDYDDCEYSDDELEAFYEELSSLASNLVDQTDLKPTKKPIRRQQENSDDDIDDNFFELLNSICTPEEESFAVDWAEEYELRRKLRRCIHVVELENSNIEEENRITVEEIKEIFISIIGSEVKWKILGETTNFAKRLRIQFEFETEKDYNSAVLKIYSYGYHDRIKVEKEEWTYIQRMEMDRVNKTIHKLIELNYDPLVNPNRYVYDPMFKLNNLWWEYLYGIGWRLVELDNKSDNNN